MANSHCAVKTGATGKAFSHASYICGTEKYVIKGKEEVIFFEHGNMPSFSKNEPMDFWKAADEFGQKSYTATHHRKRDGAEKIDGMLVPYKKGDAFEKTFHSRSYRENEGSVPRELKTHQEQITFVKKMAEKICGKNHPYTFAVHAATAKDGLPNVNYHLMFSEKMIDSHDRDRDHFFKKVSMPYKDSRTKKIMPARPEKGGAERDRQMNSREFVQKVRALYAATAAEFGIERDMRSNRERGLDVPEPKIGPIHNRNFLNPVHALKVDFVQELRRVRNEREIKRDFGDYDRLFENIKNSKSAVLSEMQKSDEENTTAPPKPSATKITIEQMIREAEAEVKANKERSLLEPYQFDQQKTTETPKPSATKITIEDMIKEAETEAKAAKERRMLERAPPSLGRGR